jgi:hypothetical protein
MRVTSFICSLIQFSFRGLIVFSVGLFSTTSYAQTVNMYDSVVKVEVTVGNEVNIATGFVYGDEKMVVSALHAMNPDAQSIVVRCRNISANASVEKILREADLVLLRPSRELSRCKPLEKVNEAVPNSHKGLNAYGHRPGNTKRAFSQRLNLGDLDDPASNSLRMVIDDSLEEAFTKLRLPSLDLPVYHVNGGLYKGYSGGPVVDEEQYLVGIASGGLENGQKNHNWIVPISNLRKLMDLEAIPENQVIPPILATASRKGLFSAAVKSSAVANAAGEDEDTAADLQFVWIKTKTSRFDELLKTAEKSLGLESLYDDIIKRYSSQPTSALTFDIYEEAGIGFIIAMPAGVDPFHTYNEDANSFSFGSKLDRDIQGMVDVSYDDAAIKISQGVQITPDNPDYRQYLIDETLKKEECGEQVTCRLERADFRESDFGGGHKIIRIGYYLDYVGAISGTQDTDYVQSTFAIKDNKLMSVRTNVSYSQNSTMSACFTQKTEASCGDRFLIPASFILANAMTTFSGNFGRTSVPIAPRFFDYKCDNTLCVAEQTPSAYNEFEVKQGDIGIYYDANGQALFERSADGGAWFMKSGEQWVSVQEEWRETWSGQVHYILSLNGVFYAVPVGDGFVYNWDGFSWSAQRPLSFVATGADYQARRSDIGSFINLQGQELFRLQEDGSWLVNIDGQLQLAQEVSREYEITEDRQSQEHAVISIDNYFYKVPISSYGDNYFEGANEGEWVKMGIVYLEGVEQAPSTY